MFRLHEVQLQLDDARGALDTLQRQQQLQADVASPRQFQRHMSPPFVGQPGNDEPRPQQLPHQLRQRAPQRAPAADSTADADALLAARQQISAQGRQLTKQVLLQADSHISGLTHDAAGCGHGCQPWCMQYRGNCHAVLGPHLIQVLLQIV